MRGTVREVLISVADGVDPGETLVKLSVEGSTQDAAQDDTVPDGTESGDAAQRHHEQEATS